MSTTRSASVATAQTGVHSITSAARSTSRGRLPAAPAVHFGGRGGAGNVIRSPSRGRNLELVQTSTTQSTAGTTRAGDEGLDELEEGEEPTEVVRAARNTVKERSKSRGREEYVPAGRGGRGNMRSASRSAATPEEVAKARQEIEREREVEQAFRAREVGRGGVGFGRGGRGNVVAGSGRDSRKGENLEGLTV